MSRDTALIYASASIAFAAVIALFLITRRDDPSAPNEPTVASAATASASAPSAAMPMHLPAANATTAVHSSAVAAPADAADDAFDPIADDSWKLLKPGDPPAPGDPFEDPDVKVQRAKLLSRVGTIRVGTLNKDAVVKDEAAVITILRRAASEIDRLDRDRRDPPHKRFAEYEALMAKYTEELRPHMAGTVLVGGLGWTLGVTVPGDAGS